MEVELEILQSSYWEHFKALNECAKYLAIDNPKRAKLQAEVNKIAKELSKYKQHEKE